MAFLRINIKSEEIAQSVDIDVFLPVRSKLVSCRPPFKTLYFLPGYSASSRESITFMNMQMHALTHGIALVMISGDRSFYTDQEPIHEMYGRFVGKELVELTRELLPLSHRREDTYIGGISMGGYGAICNGLRFRDTFSKIAVLSPAIWYPGLGEKDMIPEIRDKVERLMGSFEELTAGRYAAISYLDRTLAEGGELPDFFIRYGNEDVLVREGNEAFLRDLAERNIEIDYQAEPGAHDLVFWSEMMKSTFDFLTEDIYGMREEC